MRRIQGRMVRWVVACGLALGAAACDDAAEVTAEDVATAMDGSDGSAGADAALQDVSGPDGADDDAATGGDTAVDTGSDGSRDGAADAQPDGAVDGVIDEATDIAADVGPDTAADTAADISTDTTPGPAWTMSRLPDTLADCPEETFLDVAAYDGAGAAYPDPVLTVSCTASTMTVKSNNIPHFTFVSVNPGTLTAQSWTRSIPLDPTVAAKPTAFGNTSTIGISIGGLGLQSPSEAGDLKYGDPVYGGILDFCLGHIDQNGGYHHHGVDSTCFAPEDPGAAASPIIGWAFDGFPIYGPFECADAACSSFVEMQSSYVEVNSPTDCVAQSYAFDGDEDEASDGDAFLDACNGHYGPDGTYHYHVTATYPYILGCFSGTPGPSATVYGGQQDLGMEAACEDGAYVGTGTGGGSCTVAADCTGKCTGGTGCTCATTPQGKACIPTCGTAADCPTGPGGTAMQCMNGACVPPKP